MMNPREGPIDPVSAEDCPSWTLPDGTSPTSVWNPLDGPLAPSDRSELDDLSRLSISSPMNSSAPGSAPDRSTEPVTSSGADDRGLVFTPPKRVRRDGYSDRGLPGKSPRKGESNPDSSAKAGSPARAGDVPDEGGESNKNAQACGELRPGAISAEVVDGASESVAKYVDPVLDEVLPCPDAGGDYSLVDTAELVGHLQGELHTALIGAPAQKIISSWGIPAADPVSIIDAMPIGFIDHSLGDIRRWIEIGGFCISIMCGHLTMALACLKALAHDEIHNAVASGVKSLITGGATEEPGSKGPLPGTGRGGGTPVTSPTAGQATRRVRVTAESAPEQKLPSRCRRGETRRKPAARAIGSGPSPGGAPAGADVDPGSRPGLKPPTAVGTSANLHPVEGQASMKRPAVPGKTSTGPGGLQGAGSPNAASSPPGGATTTVTPQPSPRPTAVPTEVMCVRLRIHYEEAEVVSAAADAQPASPAILIVGQETSALSAYLAGRTQAAATAMSTARGAETGMTWQRWRAADDSGFADGSPGADALRRRLRSILTGAAPDDDPAINVEDQPDGPGLLPAPRGCVEIMGIITSRSGHNTLESIGIKTRALDDEFHFDDEFLRIVVSAISG
jgi:hypothetical protein